jgi:hypothetical protein
MTTLTVSTLLIMVWGALSRGGYGRALALGGATGAGAAFVVGTTAVPTFYAVSAGAAVALVLDLLQHRRRPREPDRRLPPGASLLVAFLLWSVFVTLTAPMVFDGQPVLTPNGVGAVLNAGFVTTSNIAQMGYLFLGVCVVVLLGRSKKATPQLIGLAAGLTTVLSLWRYLNQTFGFPFPQDIFDNSPAFSYVETAPKGVQRFRGILSEPAGLAVSSLVTMSYMLPRALRVRGLRQIGAVLVAAAACYLGIVSTSATFVVGGALVLAVVAVVLGAGFLVRRVSIGVVATIVGCVLVLVALWLLPIVYGFVEDTISAKVTSSSYTDRSGANNSSYGIFLDTWGFGVGLGSSRASSFLPGLLSTTGLPGTLLFLAAVGTLLAGSARVDAYRPVLWAFVSLLLVKVVSGPDLSDSTGILWIALGLLSHATVLGRRAREPGLVPLPATLASPLVSPNAS